MTSKNENFKLWLYEYQTKARNPGNTAAARNTDNPPDSSDLEAKGEQWLFTFYNCTQTKRDICET